MIISEFPEQNVEFGKPRNMSHSECLPLPAFQTEDKSLIISCWKFTDDEILLTLLERKIWLRVHLPFQPPVHLSPEYPFLNEKGKSEEIEIVVERLLDRKIRSFIENRFDISDLNSGIYIADETFMTVLLRNFANFLVSTKQKASV